MPHVVIEYSDNLASDVKEADLVEILHHAIGQCGLFKPDDIKTRAYAASDFLVGENGRDGSFVHLTVSIKSGRTPEQRQALAATLLDMLKAHIAVAEQLTVDIRELDATIYQKFVR